MPIVRVTVGLYRNIYQFVLPRDKGHSQYYIHHGGGHCDYARSDMLSEASFSFDEANICRIWTMFQGVSSISEGRSPEADRLKDV